MRGELINEPTLVQIAEKYNKTTTQVILRWDIQNEVITIPKSVRKERIIENANIFDFELTSEEIEKINSLNENKRVGPNPDDLN